MKLVLSLLFISMVSTSYGYNPNNHQLLSKFISTQYNRCVNHIGAGDGITKLTTLETKYFALGAEHEDTSSPISRALNWHLYRANEYLPKNSFFDSTNKTIFHRRITQVERFTQMGLNYRIRYYYLGRLLHHLQDMTVPAHTAAIYHSNPPFGKQDSFELYDIDQEFFDSFQITTEKCEELFSENIEWYELLTRTAERTIASTKETIPNTEYTWESFWMPYDNNLRSIFKIKGFGKYGELGNTYGTNSAIPMDVYKEYKMKRMKEAVYSTIIGIMKYQTTYF